MLRIRKEYDADLRQTNLPSEYLTELNRFELLCGVCGRHLYVDEPTVTRYERAFEFDFDNQFTCNQCEEEYEDLAHEGNKTA